MIVRLTSHYKFLVRHACTLCITLPNQRHWNEGKMVNLSSMYTDVSSHTEQIRPSRRAMHSHVEIPVRCDWQLTDRRLRLEGCCPRPRPRPSEDNIRGSVTFNLCPFTPRDIDSECYLHLPTPCPSLQPHHQRRTQAHSPSLLPHSLSLSLSLVPPTLLRCE